MSSLEVFLHGQHDTIRPKSIWTVSFYHVIKVQTFIVHYILRCCFGITFILYRVRPLLQVWSLWKSSNSEFLPWRFFTGPSLPLPLAASCLWVFLPCFVYRIWKGAQMLFIMYNGSLLVLTTVKATLPGVQTFTFQSVHVIVYNGIPLLSPMAWDHITDLEIKNKKNILCPQNV